MTLCIAWKSNGKVHFASDSRLTVAQNSFADVGVKVLSLPYQILDPVDENGGTVRSVAFSGELGMCFAGSAVNSLTIKESMVEILKTLQHVPGHTDTSMAGIAKFIFTAYRVISQRICETALGRKGAASIMIGGMCPIEKSVRVFLFSTDAQNHHSFREILTTYCHEFLGSGKDVAEDNLPQNPSDSDYMNILKMVIDDPAVDSVGGNVQYGEFKNNQFVVYGIIELGTTVHYWRAALDLNSADFMGQSSEFVPGIQYLDPYSTLGV